MRIYLDRYGLKFYVPFRILSVLAAASLGFASASFAADVTRFSGGTCQSQGDWVTAAIQQASDLTNALEALRKDPNCTVLVDALDNSSPKLKELTTYGKDGQVTGIAGVYRELEALREYYNPRKESLGRTNPQSLREIVNYMVFRKGHEVAEDNAMQKRKENMSSTSRLNVDITSQRLQNFLARSSALANLSVETTKGILSKFPDSQKCFMERPNEALMIFSSVISGAAAFATGGQVTNLGELIGSIVRFNREMKFIKAIQPIERARFEASVSCLVESTQEAYCAVQDAQDALDFQRGYDGEKLKKFEEDYNPLNNPMQGLMILNRDVEKITSWMQRVLFGVDPKLIIEATMKNENWDAILGFIKDLNTLPALARDKRNYYMSATQGADRASKASQVKSVIDGLTNVMVRGAGAVNFFTGSLNQEVIPYFLLGLEELPADYNALTNNWDNAFLKWIPTGQNGLNNPDALMNNLEMRVFLLVGKANALASSYFSSRMIVDSQNLLVEGMNGPDISPYKAMMHVQIYARNLIKKLDEGLKDPIIQQNPANADGYASMIPLLEDLDLRISVIVGAMKELKNLRSSHATKFEADGGMNPISPSDQVLTVIAAARKAMDTIYEFNNMMTSRDSFIFNRVVNAVRMDITDTLWRSEHINARQSDVLRQYGKDMIAKLGAMFSQDPTLKRMDISQTAPIHDGNLKGIEEMFAKYLWQAILDIDCKVYGGHYCNVNKNLFGMPDWKANVLLPKDPALQKRASSAPWPLSYLIKKPTKDGRQWWDLRAKYCIQSLGFEFARKYFEPLCRGAVLFSEFSDEKDVKNLNVSYDAIYAQINQLKKEEKPGYLSDVAYAGNCALRSFIRRNHIYRMYTEMKDISN